MNAATDRELLELAAKACGFGGPEHLFCWTESEYPRGSDQHGALWDYVGHMDTAVLWNPLTDDGDAHRLAARLEFDVMHRVVGGRRVEVLAAGGPLIKHEYEGDIAAAMRRAIVLAAAHIGRRMQ